MVSDIYMVRLVLIYTKGLAEPLKGLWKSHRTTTLKDSINLTRDVQNVFPKSRYPRNPNFPSKFKEGRKPWKNDSFVKQNKEGPSKEELKRNKLCFICQQTWVPRHRCAKGKAHYIEVFSEYNEEELEEKVQLASQ